MDVRVDDSFWSPRIETSREVTIEYQYDQLGANAGAKRDNPSRRRLEPAR